MINRWNEHLKNHPYLAAAVLATVTLIIYSGSLANGFVSDDEHQIVENVLMRNPRGWLRILEGPAQAPLKAAVRSNFYRPLHLFSCWLVYRVAGPNPTAFHLFHLLIYAATVTLVYGIGRELLQNDLAAFLGAFLWALHPLHVEAVAWIASLCDAGFGFFYLLAFLLFLRAEKASGGGLAAHRLAALAFFLALFFKEMALSFPLLVLAYWFFIPQKEDWRRRAAAWIPYLVAAGAYLAIRRIELGFLSFAPHFWKISLAAVEAAVGMLGEHARLFFWPLHLNVFRTFEIASSLRSPWPWLAILALLGLLWVRKRESGAGFLVTWWAVALSPCLDIRQLNFPVVADRYSYIPSVGPCLAISSFALIWIPQRYPRARPHRFVLPVLGLVMLFWGIQTVRAIPNWRSNETLLGYSLRQSPNAALLHVSQALLLQFRHGDLDAASREYETALQLNQASLRPLVSVTYDSYLGLGQIAYRRGRTEEAIEFFERAIRVSPGDSPAYDYLGSLCFPKGDYTKAAEYFAKAVTVNPFDLGAHFYLGTCWMKLGKYRQAAEQFHTLVEIDPNDPAAREAEARALEAAGDAAGAAKVRSLVEKP